jgi:glycosyltransferase involved in cell wall biosynthesis
MLTFAIPTFTRSKYLTRCLRSIIDQIMTVGETVKIHVHDDGSTDDTRAVLETFRTQYPDILSYSFVDTNEGFSPSFTRAFTAPTTLWTWIMGDDDMLAAGGLQTILSVIKSQRYQFIHAVETTRDNGEPEIYCGTLLELCSRIGFLEMTGFMSCNICRTDVLQAAFKSRHIGVYGESPFIHALALLEVLADKPCAFVNMPVVELQEKQQTQESIDRWEAHNVTMRYNLVGKGLRLLAADGVIPTTLPDVFFRYLGGNLFGKILFTFFQKTSATEQPIADEQWQELVQMATLLPEDSCREKIAVIEAYRAKLDEFLALIHRNTRLLGEIETAFQAATPVNYPETYL